MKTWSSGPDEDPTAGDQKDLIQNKVRTIIFPSSCVHDYETNFKFDDSVTILAKLYLAQHLTALIILLSL